MMNDSTEECIKEIGTLITESSFINISDTDNAKLYDIKSHTTIPVHPFSGFLLVSKPEYKYLYNRVFDIFLGNLLGTAKLSTATNDTLDFINSLTNTRTLSGSSIHRNIPQGTANMLDFFKSHPEREFYEFYGIMNDTIKLDPDDIKPIVDQLISYGSKKQNAIKNGVKMMEFFNYLLYVFLLSIKSKTKIHEAALKQLDNENNFNELFREMISHCKYLVTKSGSKEPSHLPKEKFYLLLLLNSFIKTERNGYNFELFWEFDDTDIRNIVESNIYTIMSTDEIRKHLYESFKKVPKERIKKSTLEKRYQEDDYTTPAIGDLKRAYKERLGLKTIETRDLTPAEKLFITGISYDTYNSISEPVKKLLFSTYLLFYKYENSSDYYFEKFDFLTDVNNLKIISIHMFPKLWNSNVTYFQFLENVKKHSPSFKQGDPLTKLNLGLSANSNKLFISKLPQLKVEDIFNTYLVMLVKDHDKPEPLEISNAEHQKIIQALLSSLNVKFTIVPSGPGYKILAPSFNKINIMKELNKLNYISPKTFKAAQIIVEVLDKALKPRAASGGNGNFYVPEYDKYFSVSPHTPKPFDVENDIFKEKLIELYDNDEFTYENIGAMIPQHVHDLTEIMDQMLNNPNRGGGGGGGGDDPIDPSVQARFDEAISKVSNTPPVEEEAKFISDVISSIISGMGGPLVIQTLLEHHRKDPTKAYVDNLIVVMRDTMSKLGRNYLWDIKCISDKTENIKRKGFVLGPNFIEYTKERFKKLFKSLRDIYKIALGVTIAETFATACNDKFSNTSQTIMLDNVFFDKISPEIVKKLKVHDGFISDHVNGYWANICKRFGIDINELIIEADPTTIFPS
jgi:hypothetical protein